jgi:hypothetical protein
MASAAGISPALSAPAHPAGTLASGGLLSPVTGTLPSSAIASLPSSISSTPWVASLAHKNPNLKPLTSLPNLALLQNPGAMVNGHVTTYYVAQPAPLGLADYGLGATTYSYNTSHLMGQVVFNTPPNATNPGATDVIEPQGQSLGYIGSPYTFGIQLNTIATNITIPGPDTNYGFFWTQNVVNWNETGIHFVDDTFNFSAGSSEHLQYNTILSGCGTNTLGVDQILYVYGGVFQCVGGTIPVSAASYPVTLQLYNNATTTAGNDSQITYGYRIVEAGTGMVYTGISDTIVFNNTNAAVAPPSGYKAPKPGYSIDGFDYTPSGFLRDAEIVLVGGIGGDNAVFRSLNGTLNLEYSNATTGGWQNVPSAYDYGSDTGETSAGIAGYWTPSHTEEINAGPAMLYGLWNAEPQVSVHSGDIEIGGTLNPSYGFIFVSNTAPVPNPFASGARDNMSWLPTTNSGSFATYLPPLGAPWTTTYYVQAFADGSVEFNTTVSASTSTLSIALTHAQGLLRAPLYAYSNAQIAALALNTTGATTAPWDFSGLTVNVNSSFNHLNDYNYPSFEVFNAVGLTQVVNVSDLLLQGADAAGGNTYYISDHPASYPAGLLAPGPELAFGGANTPLYTSEFQMFGDVGNQLYVEILVSFGGANTNGVFWHDLNAHVNETLEVDYGFLFVGDSVGTTILNSEAEDTDGGLIDIGSTHTTVWNYAVLDALGIEALSSHNGVYSWLNVTDSGLGIEAGQDFGSSVNYDQYYDLPGTTGVTVNDLNVTDDAFGANFTFSEDTTFNSIGVYDPVHDEAGGVQLDSTDVTAINDLSADYGTGTFLWNATDTTITNLVDNNEEEFFANEWSASTGTTLTGGTFVNTYWVELGSYDTATTLTTVNVTGAYAGIILEYPSGFTGTTLNSYRSEFPYELDYGMPGAITVTGVNAVDLGAWPQMIGFNLNIAYPFTVTNVNAVDVGLESYAAGVQVIGCLGGSVTGVTASYGSVGARLDMGTMGVSVTTVSATYGSIGVYIDPSGGIISGATAMFGSVGVELNDATNVTITGTTASDASLGADIFDSTLVTVTKTTVSDSNSTGLLVEDSSFVQVSGVTASASSLLGTLSSGFEGLANAAIETAHTETTILSDVTATNFGAALYDVESTGLQVSNVNGTSGLYGVALLETFDSYFNGIGAYKDWIGLAMLNGYASEYNYVTGSSFVDDSSYGVAILDGYDNTLTMNNFIGDNGATGTYNPAHIQAWAGDDYEYFYSWTGDNAYGIGNYWADWHTYGSNGYLAPYIVTGESMDEFPIGPQETFAVSFNATGLPAATMWSVTLGGVTQSSSSSVITFTETMGTYAYSIGSLTGWTATPSSGSVVLTGASYNVPVAFSAIDYAVTLTAGGLSTGTTWSATVNGVTQSTSGMSLVFELADGTYTYKFNNVSGYNLASAGASGSVVVANAPVSLSASYSPVTTPSYVSTDTFNQWLAVAFAVAVIALVIALLALLLRRRREEQQAQGAQPWTPPAGTGGSSSGGSGSWSEGPPAGGSPPS